FSPRISEKSVLGSGIASKTASVTSVRSTVVVFRPKASATSWAALISSGLDEDGMMMPSARSAPTARVQSPATTAESIPPLSPKTKRSAPVISSCSLSQPAIWSASAVASTVSMYVVGNAIGSASSMSIRQLTAIQLNGGQYTMQQAILDIDRLSVDVHRGLAHNLGHRRMRVDRHRQLFAGDVQGHAQPGLGDALGRGNADHVNTQHIIRV